MKKRIPSIVFICLCIIVVEKYVFQTSIVVKTDSSLEENRSMSKAQEKTHSFVGMQEYLMRMKANPKTGRVDVADVVKARNAADKLAENQAQKSEHIDWAFLGPNDVGGRTRAILVDKDNSQRLIIGGVSGGIFTSDNGGLNWTDHPQNLEFLSLSISAIAQAPNGDIYVGTGENFDGRGYGEGKLGSTVLPGTGVYKSTDRGESFQLLEATIPTLTGSNFYNQNWAAIQDIEVSPSNPNLVYVATSNGLQISEDGGLSWSKANGVSSTSVTYDIAVAADGTTHVLVGSRYYHSEDGLNFTNLTNTSLMSFETSSGNKVLAMSPSDNDYLYIVTLLGGSNYGCLRKVWQSKDGGETWAVIGEGEPGVFDPMSNGFACQGYYDLCMTVDPLDRERIFLAGVTLWSWTPEASWNQLDGGADPFDVHPDKHTLVFDPNNPNTLYIGSDGGITRSLDAQNESPTFEAINKNYITTQFYGIAAGIDGKVIGGTQDNGTIFLDGEGGSIFQNQTYITGGDGGFCDISKIKPLAVFAEATNGRIKRTGSSQPPLSSFFDLNTDCGPTTPEGSCQPDGELDGNPLYITPFLLWEDLVAYAIDSTVQKTKFITGACDGRVWMTEGALDFTAVSSWRQIGKFAGSRCISALAVSNDGKTAYAGTASGRMIRISNLDSPETTTNEFVVSSGQYITSIEVGFNPSDLIVGLGNYGRDQNIMQSFNATSINPTFTSIQFNLPLMPVYAVAVSDFNPVNSLIVGTELGIWTYDTNTETWTEENDEMGRVPVHSLRFEVTNYLGCEALYAGTHGRGLYRSTHFTLPACGELFPEDPVGIGTLNQLSQIDFYPNPMQEKSTLEITLEESLDLSLQIFDLTGRKIRELDLGELQARTHKIEVERGELIAGTYLVVLFSEESNEQVTKRLVVAD